MANRLGVVQRVKDSHGGPITSEKELEDTLKKFADETKQQHILGLEIFYQRDIIYEARAVIDKSIFKTRYKADNGRFSLPLNVCSCPDPPSNTAACGTKEQLAVVFRNWRYLGGAH